MIDELHRKDAADRKTKLTFLPEDFTPPQKKTLQPSYGISFDIGTTTVVAMLWDLKNGAQLGILARTNPQTMYGADVITRIQYVMKKPKNINVLAAEIRRCMAKMTEELCEICDIDGRRISRVSVAGNTTMSHIFLGYDPSSLARAPFAPAYTGMQVRSASEIWKNTEDILKDECKGSLFSLYDDAPVYVLPNIAGHVGGDITAAVLSSRLMKKRGLHLLIDIGTNGEIALSDGHTALACSTAAGPAFEGAGIACGMRAKTGAIEKFSVQDGQINIKTIDDGEPCGICGSGLIDIIAVMLDLGIVNKTGKLMMPEELDGKGVHPDIMARLQRTDRDKRFVIAETDKKTVTITQNDIREVQMAKGAVAGGICVMLKELGQTTEALESAMIAGAFGSFIDRKNAVRIGLLPDIAQEKILSIGNAAGAGAVMAMLSEEERAESAQIPENIRHVELASHPDFQREYIRGMGFSHLPQTKI